MKLPFPIRGTAEWDAREFERFQQGAAGNFSRFVPNVMSFGQIPIPVRNPNADMRDRTVYALEQYGADPEDIQKWADGCGK